jgi:hypothetical protein
MSSDTRLLRVAASLALCAVALIAQAAADAEVDGSGFTAAAQEISQLFWLAETATVCGWASDQDALKFKRFSLRFFAARLPDAHMRAIASLVGANGYESAVRHAAEESSALSCSTARCHDGWLAYKAAADQHEQEF